MPTTLDGFMTKIGASITNKKSIEAANERLKVASDNLATGESELRKAEQAERDAHYCFSCWSFN